MLSWKHVSIFLRIDMIHIYVYIYSIYQYLMTCVRFRTMGSRQYPYIRMSPGNRLNTCNYSNWLYFGWLFTFLFGISSRIWGELPTQWRNPGALKELASPDPAASHEATKTEQRMTWNDAGWGPPSDVCWFINQYNLHWLYSSYIYRKP